MSEVVISDSNERTRDAASMIRIQNWKSAAEILDVSSLSNVFLYERCLNLQPIIWLCSPSLDHLLLTFLSSTRRTEECLLRSRKAREVETVD